MEQGTQIIYVPTHADGDVTHPDCESGFVTSVRPGFAFCRYWRKGKPGELRTKGNSKRTPLRALVAQDSVPQSRVNEALYELGYFD